MISSQIGLEAGPGGPTGLRAEGTDLPEQGAQGGQGQSLLEERGVPLGRSPCSCADLSLFFHWDTRTCQIF